MQRSLDFYCNVLGFPVMKVLKVEPRIVKELYGLDENTDVKVVMVRTGWGSFLELFEFTPMEDGEEVKWNRQGITHIALDVGNVRKAHRELKAKGFEFMIDPMITEGTEWIFMKDPDGNLVELLDMGWLHYANRLLGKFVGKLNMLVRYRNLSNIYEKIK